MFSSDFYPTYDSLIADMLHGYDITGKVGLEPSAGKGDIVDYLVDNGAKKVIACENNQDLKKILQTKCKIIADDFLTVTASDVSHIDFICMNPPFSADEKHIIHAFNIAPPGCKIFALCNFQTYANPRTRERQILKAIIDEHGTIQNIGATFNGDQAERVTNVEIGLIRISRPGQSYSQEFEGFFTDDEPEVQGEGIMTYNAIREIVNRYVAAVKVYDEQLQVGMKMNSLTSSFYKSKFGFACTVNEAPMLREDFKKDLQRNAWNWVFNQMGLEKYATKGLRDDINKFVEQQEKIPFTMRNIYKMLDIVIGTTASRMDRAIIEVFDKLTKHHAENRHNVEGWKTNSHYLMGMKFIMPGAIRVGFSGQMTTPYSYMYSVELIDDLVKALCYITGTNYDDVTRLSTFIDRMKCNWGQWYDWAFFEIKGFKKGTLHCKFQNEQHWALFNQHVARIKGYPLPESVKRHAHKN